MADLRVIYVAFGSAEVLAQTAISLLSLARAEGKWPPQQAVRIYTDRPDFFSAFAGHAEIATIDAGEMARWIAAADGYRNIVKCHLLARQESSFVFLDSDTLVVRPFAELETELRPGVAFFQNQEYRLGARESCARLVAAKEPGCDASTWMYNSGLLAVHGKDIAALRGAPELAVKFRRDYGIGPAEQLADAVLLAQKAEIRTAGKWIVHYWQDKVFFREFVGRVQAGRSWSDWLRTEWGGADDPFRQLGLRMNPRAFAVLMKVQELCERFKT